ncbi:MAG: T9SS type A sorting domain-containing protein [Ignavibacteria bacterium]|nr:T9SS type A sorting domain-containing protein [Ignavibacteria bacterium]
MRLINFLFTLILSVLIFSFSANSQTVTLNINGLEDLGVNYQYEGWLIVAGMPVTTGTFTVDANGMLSQTVFGVNISDLINATTFVLTIEPIPDPDPLPSSTHILGGNFTNFDAPLSVGHPAALGDDYSSIDGNYILATPTNGDMTDELSGLWFLDLTGGSPAVGLTIPTLPAGWKYEGWAVISGIPVTTGTFTAVDMVDDADPFSGPDPGPPFPGEDFLVNAPPGLTFPTDLSGMTAVVSIEPDPDNSTAPFLLKPFVGGIPSPAMDHVTYMMNSNVANSFPTGTATRSAIVPVELSSFTASVSDGEVLLNWITATETNNLGFEIERMNQSSDNAWQKIGFVAGNGTTTESQSYSFSDDISSINASSLSYRLKQIDFNGVFEYSNIINVTNLALSDYVLEQNYPNPFNPSTTIKFGLPEKSNVVITVYNSLGAEVSTLVNEVREAGSYEINFNANNFSSGIYYYKIASGNFVETKKMILLK